MKKENKIIDNNGFFERGVAYRVFGGGDYRVIGEAFQVNTADANSGAPQVGPDLFDDVSAGIEAAIPAPTGSELARVESEQRTREWHYARMECFTGSRIPNLMKRGRGKGEEWGETAKGVIMELAMWQMMTDDGRAEWIDQQMKKDFVQTRWGNEHEEAARQVYAERTGHIVRECSFRRHRDITYLGGSFDGEVMMWPGSVDDGVSRGDVIGIIEIKCPFDPVNHLKNVGLSRVGLDASHDYYGQIQCNIEVAGVDWCDFISYDPRMKFPHDLCVIRVPRDLIYISAMLDRVKEAKGKMDAYLRGGTL